MSTDSSVTTGTAYARRAREAAITLGKTLGRITINDVRNTVGDPPAHVSPQVMGTVFRGKNWRKVGLVNSEREVAASRKIAQFEYVGSAA